MTDAFIKTVLEYGISGVTILILLFLLRILFKYLEKKDKEHCEERAALIAQLEKGRQELLLEQRTQVERVLEVAEKSNSIVQQNTNIVSDVRSLLTTLISQGKGR